MASAISSSSPPPQTSVKVRTGKKAGPFFQVVIHNRGDFPQVHIPSQVQASLKSQFIPKSRSPLQHSTRALVSTKTVTQLENPAKAIKGTEIIYPELRTERISALIGAIASGLLDISAPHPSKVKQEVCNLRKAVICKRAFEVTTSKPPPIFSIALDRLI